MKWIESTKCQHYSKLVELKDTLITEYKQWKKNLEPTKDGIKFSERYGEGAHLGWWGLPLIDATKINDEYAQHWPNTMKVLKEIPGVLNVCVNFIQPNTRIPDHTDDYWDLSEEVVGKVRAYGTMIGISMPSTNPDVVGFHVEGEVKSWDTGEIVSFDGLKKHGGWNNSDEWRVTMILDIKEEYWHLK